jgi:hypothetical protein
MKFLDIQPAPRRRRFSEGFFQKLCDYSFHRQALSACFRDEAGFGLGIQLNSDGHWKEALSIE